MQRFTSRRSSTASGRPCDEATVVAASPISHVDPSDAPILLTNGEVDQLVPPDQAVRMAAALEAAGVSHELVLIPDAGHDELSVTQAHQPSFDFLHRELGGVAPGPPGIVVGGDGGSGVLAPTIVVAGGGLAVVVVLVALRGRRRVQY
jgi:Prolyl oligopeptidase family